MVELTNQEEIDKVLGSLKEYFPEYQVDLKGKVIKVFSCQDKEFDEKTLKLIVTTHGDYGLSYIMIGTTKSNHKHRLVLSARTLDFLQELNLGPLKTLYGRNK